MKIILKKIVPVALLASSLIVSLNAAEEKYEEFARQFMPQIQKTNEQLREECGNAKRLKAELEEKIKAMLPEAVVNNRLFDRPAYSALCSKIEILDDHEAAWAKTVKDCYFKHKSGLISSEKLTEDDNIWTKQAQTWKTQTVDKILRNEIAEKNSVIPKVVKVPNCNWSIGKYEVTQAEYEKIMGKNPSHFKGDKLPVERVSWHDAVAFCEKLTKFSREVGLIKNNQSYRLPTVKEWRYACCAGTKTRFCSGDTTEVLSRVAWWRDNSGGKTHPVGTKAPNAWGIYDMHGNVWEWCSARVGCGGGFYGDADDCKSLAVVSFRGNGWRSSSEFGSLDSSDPDSHADDLGFRVVLAPVENR